MIIKLRQARIQIVDNLEIRGVILNVTGSIVTRGGLIGGGVHFGGGGLFDGGEHFGGDGGNAGHIPHDCANWMEKVTG